MSSANSSSARTMKVKVQYQKSKSWDVNTGGSLDNDNDNTMYKTWSGDGCRTAPTVRKEEFPNFSPPGRVGRPGHSASEHTGSAGSSSMAAVPGFLPSINTPRGASATATQRESATGRAPVNSMANAIRVGCPGSSTSRRPNVTDGSESPSPGRRNRPSFSSGADAAALAAEEQGGCRAPSARRGAPESGVASSREQSVRSARRRRELDASVRADSRMSTATPTSRGQRKCFGIWAADGDSDDDDMVSFLVPQADECWSTIETKKYSQEALTSQPTRRDEQSADPEKDAVVNTPRRGRKHIRLAALLKDGGSVKDIADDIIVRSTSASSDATSTSVSLSRGATGSSRSATRTRGTSASSDATSTSVSLSRGATGSYRSGTRTRGTSAQMYHSNRFDDDDQDLTFVPPSGQLAPIPTADLPQMPAEEVFLADPEEILLPAPSPRTAINSRGGMMPVSPRKPRLPRETTRR